MFQKKVFETRHFIQLTYEAMAMATAKNGAFEYSFFMSFDYKHKGNNFKRSNFSILKKTSFFYKQYLLTLTDYNLWASAEKD